MRAASLILAIPAFIINFVMMNWHYIIGTIVVLVVLYDLLQGGPAGGNPDCPGMPLSRYC